MIFTKKDYENLKIIKDKVGTWKQTDNLLGFAHRTSRRLRSRFKAGAEKYNLKANYAEKVEARINDYVDKDIIEYTKPQKIERTPTMDKYNVRDQIGIISLSYKDYSYYDEKAETWRVGVYSNLETHKKISKGKSRQIRGGALKQIRKMNKAKHFLKQKDISVEKAYKMAGDWQKRYQKQKIKIKNIAYKDKNGRYHWGKKGSGKKGQFASEEEVKKLLEKLGINKDKKLTNQVSKYIDEIFNLKES